MDNQRMFLYAAFGLILMIIWMEWQRDYNTPPPVSSEEVAVVDEDTLDVPEVSDTLEPNAVVSSQPAQQDTAVTDAQRIQVSTDALDVVLSTQGGTVLEVKLKKYPVSIEEQETPFLLMSDQPAHYFIAQSGLQSKESAAPTHLTLYSIDQEKYALKDGSDELRVPMLWRENGIEVIKTFVFKRDSHVIDIEYTINNNSGSNWIGNQYRQLQRRGHNDSDGSMFMANAYVGGVISSQEKRYEKISFDDMEDENLKKTITGGWAAIIQHYFLAAWAPAADESNIYYNKALTDRDRYVLGLKSHRATVPSGQSAQLKSTLYAGPKIQDDLADVAANLNLTVDYGFLSILAEPLFLFLKWVYGFVGNWGWAILIVTLAIKLVFYKLSEVSYRSMARMRKLQPKMIALKERYGDDRTKMGQATMELYKKEKVNPLGGCLPILIQIPVFIALYWVLLESVELRQAPWILWIKDLAIKDPYYILPIIMGATMLIQQKLNPAPIDPIQAKVFMIMPFAFTIFFAFFPSGLVLYWVANNTLSIAQQYYITRHVLAEDKK